VNDPHASKVSFQRAGEERPQRFLRFRYGETVQINLRLDPVLTTAQLAQDRLLDPVAREDQFLATGGFGIVNVRIQALLQNRAPIGARKAGARGRAAGRFFRGRVVSQRLDVPHGLAEEVGIVLIELGFHATSAKWRQKHYSDAPFIGSSLRAMFSTMYLKTATA
jgi:hypothetical protein